MTGCPFYGFQWPDRTPILKFAGGNVCGLDVDGGSKCLMESEGREVNYFTCPRALEQRQTLDSAKHLIGFRGADGTLRSLEEWQKGRRG